LVKNKHKPNINININKTNIKQTLACKLSKVQVKLLRYLQSKLKQSRPEFFQQQKQTNNNNNNNNEDDFEMNENNELFSNEIDLTEDTDDSQRFIMMDLLKLRENSKKNEKKISMSTVFAMFHFTTAINNHPDIFVVGEIEK